jgi:hypothetical protein
MGLAAVVAFFAHDWVYLKEFRAMRAAAKEQGFEVGRSWMYDEDFALEDFGFYIIK